MALARVSSSSPSPRLLPSSVTSSLLHSFLRPVSLRLARSPLPPKKIPRRRRLLPSISFVSFCEGGGGGDGGTEAQLQAPVEAHVFVLHPGQVHHGLYTRLQCVSKE